MLDGAAGRTKGTDIYAPVSVSLPYLPAGGPGDDVSDEG